MFMADYHFMPEFIYRVNIILGSIHSIQGIPLSVFQQKYLISLFQELQSKLNAGKVAKFNA